MFIRSRIASLTFSVRPSRTEVAPTMFCQKLVGVADLNPAALEWFDDGQTFLTPDYRQLLDRDEVEVVYVAVPHNLHEKIYREVLEAGKDLLAEKPFGIDLA